MPPPRISFDYTPFGNPVSWVAGVLVAGDDTAFSPFGTGFLAAPGLAFTARHVIDEISRRFANTSLCELRGEMSFGVQLATSDPSSGRMLRWDVTDYHYSANIDIIGLTIECAEDPPVLFLPRFDLSPPPEGSQISAFGYPDTRSRQIAAGQYRFQLQPRTSTGVVRTIHHQYRDRVMLPFPCMQTNARLDAGMSGGPVFDQAGHICAVVSTGMGPPQEGGEHYSHASLFWPALGLRFNERQRTGEAPPRFLRSAAETGSMQI
jgi:hypothetical protein